MTNTSGVGLEVVARGRTGSVIGGRFRLEQRIGAGGMGEVYRATHLELGVSVAVKLLDPTIASVDKAVARFRREARAAARLKSAHIVHVYDFGVDEGIPFLVMELLEGESVSDHLARVGTLSLTKASNLLDQASRGLAAAHVHGIVHRDVKPSNLFLARTADGEALKVLDFGIAKPAEEEVAITRSQDVIGSPLYMSPEQANGEAVDHRSDVWSLAAVAFRMVTGGDAFHAASTSSVLVKICSGTARKASALVSELPLAVDAFFERAFSRELSARFQTAAELAAAFARVADPPRRGESDSEFFRSKTTATLAPPAPPRAQRLWAWLAVGTLVLMGLGGWLWSRSTDQHPAPASSSLGTPSEPEATAAPAEPQALPAARASAKSALVAVPSASATRTPVSAASASASPVKSLVPPPRRAPKRPDSAPNGAASASKPARDPLFGL